VRFWDSSALVPLIVGEPSSSALRALLEHDAAIAAWWGSRVECIAAVARKARAGEQSHDASSRALQRLLAFAEEWVETPPTDPLREAAVRLVRVHDLRAGDAFQLAAARVASDERPEILPFVTLDERLAEAARREGFTILGLD
jgi:predicted nucleic acid-binding protein